MNNLASFSSIGFSGSRQLSGVDWEHCRSLAASAVKNKSTVLVGCAVGADATARAGAGDAAIIFSAESRYPPALVGRSIRFVRTLAVAPSPCLISFPVKPCAAHCVPAPDWISSGSGSWSSAALAANLQLPIFVFLPDNVSPPALWGTWLPILSGDLVGAWFFAPTTTPS